jgi:hypothetical protein
VSANDTPALDTGKSDQQAKPLTVGIGGEKWRIRIVREVVITPPSGHHTVMNDRNDYL